MVSWWIFGEQAPGIAALAFLKRAGHAVLTVAGCLWSHALASRQLPFVYKLDSARALHILECTSDGLSTLEITMVHQELPPRYINIAKLNSLLQKLFKDSGVRYSIHQHCEAQQIGRASCRERV